MSDKKPLQLQTSMPELGDFALALRDATPFQRRVLLDRVLFGMETHDQVPLVRTLHALIKCICTENDLEIG